MAFSDDNGGFAFSCRDAKMSICASTWSTRLSQIGRIIGPISIMTGSLPDPGYIGQILEKRPRDIWIVANSSAHTEAKQLKQRFPFLRIALHRDNNAKIVLVAPETVWVSSSDFGRTNKIESAVGLHSNDAYQKALDHLFKKFWKEATEI